MCSIVTVGAEGYAIEESSGASISIDIKENGAESEDTDINSITEGDASMIDDNDLRETDTELSDTNENNDEEDEEITMLSDNTDEADYWMSVAGMGTSRAGSELVTIDSELYAVGGIGASGYLNTIEKYNEDNDVWVSITNIPDNIKGFGVVSYNSKIYIIGGYASDYLNTVIAYDVATDSWSSIASMNEKRDQPAVLCMDNKIYVFGGRNNSGFVNSYEYYDFSANAWDMVTTGFSDTMIRVGAHAQYIDGYVCIYGGIDTGYNYAGVDMYLSSELKNTKNIITDGNEWISAAWGSDKALLFIWDRQTNMYNVKEMTVENDDVMIGDVIINSASNTGKYAGHIIYNGYLYELGGYNLNSKSYLGNVNKYSIYYGDYSVGDGTINSAVTSNGNSVTLNVEAGREYMLLINAKNISSFDGYTFKIDYADNAFTLVDGCAMTANKDIDVGTVNGSDIKITANDTNGVSFECTEELNKTVTKSVNAVLLKANSSGQRTIKYSMVKN